MPPGTDSPNPPTDGPYLTQGASPEPGVRRLSIVGPDGRWTVDFPIPAPEIQAAEGYFVEGPDRVVLVRGPLDRSLARRLSELGPQAIVVTNSRALWEAGETFVATLALLREAVGVTPLLWLPRVALPNRLAFLTYLGADLLDTTEAEFRAAEGIYLDAELGAISDETARAAIACPCPGCASSSLAGHAVHALTRELARVRSATTVGCLRELVESRLPSDPRLAEMLRFADRIGAPLLEEPAPVVSDRAARYVLAESFRRPEARRFRARFIERYRPPPSKSVLLVVPCSATKPYRLSPTHRRFQRALDGLPGLGRVHVVSVTSPLGIVPRELEDVYPARHYDIPVTGDWTEPERESVKEAVEHLLARGPYTTVAFHLDPEEYGFLRNVATGPRAVEWTVVGSRTGSPESLDGLRRAVAHALEGQPELVGGPLAVVREELEALAGLQFGPEAARALFAPPARLAGRPWFQRLTDGHHADLATLREERGLFQLTIAGGRRIFAQHVLEVEVDPTLRLEGDVFAPGVTRADPLIRMGDAVVVSADGILRAVGEAALPGPWMTSLPYGLAVRVRHRTHETGDRSRGATAT